MKNYLIKRILMIIPTLLIITFVSYMIMDLAPGDPTLAWIDFEHNRATPEVLAEMRERLGLNAPWYIRYFKWLGQVFQGNLGYSLVSQRPVSWEISQRINVTLFICLISMLLSAFIGVVLGVLAAIKQYKWQDTLIQIITYITMSVPQSWICLLLILAFVLKWKLLPATGLQSLMMIGGTPWEIFVDRLKHVVLPVMCMTIPGIGSWARYQRGAFLEAMHQDYVRTARSKGLAERTITFKHILRNASLPTITSIAGMLPGIVTSSTLIESVFGIPGLGGALTSAVTQRDYTMTMASMLILGVLTLAGVLLSDILYAVVDPRIRYR